jgi:hypothetical protein
LFIDRAESSDVVLVREGEVFFLFDEIPLMANIFHGDQFIRETANDDSIFAQVEQLLGQLDEACIVLFVRQLLPDIHFFFAEYNRWQIEFHIGVKVFIKVDCAFLSHGDNGHHWLFVGLVENLKGNWARLEFS